MSRIAVFPGSFDPITKGHVNIVERALPLFDKIIVAVGNNSLKKYAFSFERREQWIKEIFKKHSKVEVTVYQGLTVTFMKQVKANYLLRGIRNGADFDYENTIAQLNKAMSPELETICLMSDPQHAFISSTMVRDIYNNGGNPAIFLPEEVKL